MRDTAEPWNATVLEIASLLLDSVSRAHSSRLVELDHLRSQLWAVLGHDLRDPLQSITMAAKVLDRAGSSERMTTVIRNSTTRMQHLLRDLQDITRVQNGLQLTMSPEPVDLVALVSRLVEDTRVAYPDTQLETRLPDRLQAEVDASRYVQVLSNLLSNARHHGSGGIKLELLADATHVQLTVTNSAPPIPDDVVVGLFDPFKRTARPNPRNPGSMGLGLYIAHQVLLAHGGTLSYQPLAGRVAFIARVPLIRAKR